MAGGFVGGSPPRIRIKGKTASVMRFFTIAVAFMITWILITSLLDYYARFGRSILLQLNLAFYLPSIPILIISGQIEKLMEDRFGPIYSMMLRLNVGLAGSAAICAAFPFIRTTHTVLLWLVAVLGMLSAIAFSTSYQVVQYFRHADIIALGIGGVGSGPMVLLLQLLLGVGPLPERWQWIAMFEVSAGIVLIGLLSSLSLFGQYWSILTGEQLYDEGLPLLHDDQSEHEMALATAPTANVLLTPDPFHGMPMVFSPDRLQLRNSFDDAPVLLPRSNSFGSTADLALLARSHKAAAYSRSRSMPRRLWQAGTDPPESVVNQLAHTTHNAPAQPAAHHLAPPTNNKPAEQLSASAPAALDGVGFSSPASNAGHLNSAPAASAAPAAAGPAQPNAVPVSTAELPAPKAEHVSSSTSHSRDADQGMKSSHAPAPNAFALHAAQPSQTMSPQAAAGTVADTTAGTGAQQSAAAVVTVPMTQAHATEHAHEEGDAAEHASKMTVKEETWAALQGMWQVMVGFLVSVTILYLIFPFFTYFPTSGLVGDALPRVLFFVRIFADIFGRFVPRCKTFLVRSPSIILLLAGAKIVLALLVFLYIKAPHNFHHDVLSIAMIILIWTAGGYINTSANILAPSLVEPSLCVRASALMALTFQIAHFGGLLLAVIMKYALYGDFSE